MDNRFLNINGRTKEQLALGVKFMMLDEYGRQRKISGWYVNPSKGFVMTWLVKEDYIAKPFTNRLGIQCDISGEELVDILWDWLHSEEAKKIHLEDFEENILDFDGSTHLGWRLYVDHWGKVAKGIDENSSLDDYSVCAFKPMYCWYGK